MHIYDYLNNRFNNKSFSSDSRRHNCFYRPAYIVGYVGSHYAVLPMSFLRHFPGDLGKARIVFPVLVFRQPPLDGYPAGFFEEYPIFRQDFPGLPRHIGDSGKIRLGRRGKHHGAVVFPAQGLHRLHRRLGQVPREALGLVKEDDAVGDVMEFPAIRGPVGKQTFKKNGPRW